MTTTRLDEHDRHDVGGPAVTERGCRSFPRFPHWTRQKWTLNWSRFVRSWRKERSRYGEMASAFRPSPVRNWRVRSVNCPGAGKIRR